MKRPSKSIDELSFTLLLVLGFLVSLAINLTLPLGPKRKDNNHE